MSRTKRRLAKKASGKDKGPVTVREVLQISITKIAAIFPASHVTLLISPTNHGQAPVAFASTGDRDEVLSVMEAFRRQTEPTKESSNVEPQ